MKNLVAFIVTLINAILVGFILGVLSSLFAFSSYIESYDERKYKHYGERRT